MTGLSADAAGLGRGRREPPQVEDPFPGEVASQLEELIAPQAHAVRQPLGRQIFGDACPSHAGSPEEAGPQRSALASRQSSLAPAGDKRNRSSCFGLREWKPRSVSTTGPCGTATRADRLAVRRQPLSPMRKGSFARHASAAGAGMVALPTPTNTSTSIILPQATDRARRTLYRRGANSPRGSANGRGTDSPEAGAGDVRLAGWPSPSTGDEVPRFCNGALPGLPSALRAPAEPGRARPPRKKRLLQGRFFHGAVTCRCTSSAATMCCARGCGHVDGAAGEELARIVERQALAINQGSRRRRAATRRGATTTMSTTCSACPATPV